MASLKQYKILQEIYKELRPKNYSMKEAFDFIRSCKVLSKNNQQLDSLLKSKTLNMRLNECLREAKKEVKMFNNTSGETNLGWIRKELEKKRILKKLDDMRRIRLEKR